MQDTAHIGGTDTAPSHAPDQHFRGGLGLGEVSARFFNAMTLITSVFLVVSAVYLLVTYPYVIKNLYYHTSYLFIIVPMVVPVFSMRGGGLCVYYTFITAFVVFSVLWSVRPLLKHSVAGEERKHWSTGTNGVHGLLVWSFFHDTDATRSVLRAVSVSIFVPVAWYFSLRAVGIEPLVPDFSEYPLWKQIYGFANAGFWEEFLTRFVYLLLPLLPAWYVSADSPSLKRYFQHILNGFEEPPPFFLPMLFFSALMFGLAHALGGWDLYKVLPSFVSGLVFGYIAVKAGFPSAVAAHFAVDFLSLTGSGNPALVFFGLVPVLLFFLSGGLVSLATLFDLARSLRSEKGY